MKKKHDLFLLKENTFLWKAWAWAILVARNYLQTFFVNEELSNIFVSLLYSNITRFSNINDLHC